MENTKSYVNAVFILDMSGSMGGRTSDVIGGFNSMISDLKTESDDIRVTTVLFNDGYYKIHERKAPNEIEELTRAEYHPQGCTALLDAVGRTMDELDLEYEKEKPEKTVFYITTDGLENSSTEYSYNLIKKMIEWHEKKEGWEIKFLASGIDIEEESRKMGIGRGNARMCDMSTSAGISEMYCCMSDEVQYSVRALSKNSKKQK